MSNLRFGRADGVREKHPPNQTWARVEEGSLMVFRSSEMKEIVRGEQLVHFEIKLAFRVRSSLTMSPPCRRPFHSPVRGAGS